MPFYVLFEIVQQFFVMIFLYMYIVFVYCVFQYLANKAGGKKHIGLPSGFLKQLFWMFFLDLLYFIIIYLPELVGFLLDFLSFVHKTMSAVFSYI